MHRPTRQQRISCAILGLAASMAALPSIAIAQTARTSGAFDAPNWTQEAYGGATSDYYTSYTAPRRDASGTRLIVNGRFIDLGEDQSGSNARQYASRVQGATLSGPTLNAMSIGNYAEITGVRNSTIVINQHNNGSQTSVAHGGGR